MRVCVVVLLVVCVCVHGRRRWGILVLMAQAKKQGRLERNSFSHTAETQRAQIARDGATGKKQVTRVSSPTKLHLYVNLEEFDRLHGRSRRNGTFLLWSVGGPRLFVFLRG